MIRTRKRTSPIAVQIIWLGALADGIGVAVLPRGLLLAEIEAMDHHQPEAVEQHDARQQQRVGVGARPGE